MSVLTEQIRFAYHRGVRRSLGALDYQKDTSRRSQHVSVHLHYLYVSS